MSKIVASYIARITLREYEGAEGRTASAPTVDALVDVIQGAITEHADETRAADVASYHVNVVAERTDT